MNDVTIIDQFLNTFATYIDSGFGLLRGEVAFLTATLLIRRELFMRPHRRHACHQSTS